MSKTIILIDGKCERPQLYGRKETDGGLIRRDGKNGNAESDGPYLVHNQNTFTLDKVARAGDASVLWSSTASSAF